jgi:hypothetical protein
MARPGGRRRFGGVDRPSSGLIGFLSSHLKNVRERLQVMTLRQTSKLSGHSSYIKGNRSRRLRLIGRQGHARGFQWHGHFADAPSAAEAPDDPDVFGIYTIGCLNSIIQLIAVGRLNALLVECFLDFSPVPRLSRRAPI